MYEYAEPIAKLIEELKKIPTIGAKTAQRIAFHLLRIPKEEAEKLAKAIVDVKEKVFYCSICNNITHIDPCLICSDDSRDPYTLMIVEEPYNVSAIEKTKAYKGRYHVLLGAISPLKGVGPENLKINSLLKRIKEGNFREIIIATNPTVEGEATASYLIDLLKNYNIKLTRIAVGLPVGSDIDYADQVTIARALEGRYELKLK
ncbi:recombination mediator RecR [Candidatus Aminicenantes bacterium AC-335-B20]|jgi:recombination protein RecR|nr:recombination mediator RecR [SCandidatus Aminicenantes bacterium Aminicenantia_JdfR_composite]MCP2597715.1 recombination mediator RecR [Candidatus Aminicenantes bacterium AC-335-G13]MCP2598893.1 recombination mediator RecR [Candidatus Aminicenantes bacterium AC-335-B20]